jgi:hypothetical protein
MGIGRIGNARMILPLLFALAILVIVIAGASWRRRGGARPPLHLSIIVLAVLVLFAGLGVIFLSRGW